MPPKRKAAKVQSDSDNDEYRKKRDRNNQVSHRYAHLSAAKSYFFDLKTVDLILLSSSQRYNSQAVKRSRVKSKQKAEETSARVQDLKINNARLEQKIENEHQNLKMLKELFLSQAQAKSEKLKGIDLKSLLEDDYDEDGNGSSSSTLKPSSTKN